MNRMVSKMSHWRSIALSALVVALLAAPRPVVAQDECLGPFAVNVRLFPLGPAYAEMQKTVECNLSEVLTAIDQQKYQRTTYITVDAAQKVVDEAMGKYRTRQPLYRALLVPHLTDDRVYEVRGIHVLSLTDGVERQPQLAFTLDATGKITDVAIVDSAARNLEREALRSEFQGMPDAAARLQVLDMVLDLESAYAQDGAQAINQSLRTELADAFVVVSKLSESGRASEKRYPASQYADAFTRAVQSQRDATPSVGLVHLGLRGVSTGSGRQRDLRRRAEHVFRSMVRILCSLSHLNGPASRTPRSPGVRRATVDETHDEDGTAVLLALSDEAAEASSSARLVIKVGGKIQAAVTVMRALVGDQVQVACSARRQRSGLRRPDSRRLKRAVGY